MTNIFWVVYYVCLLLLDTAGIVYSSLRSYDDVMKLGKIKKTNTLLLILWGVAFTLSVIGAFIRFM